MRRCWRPKRNAAQAAIALVPQDCLLGVGTGSTTNEFIALLPDIRDRISAVVSSSQATTGLLHSQGFEVVPLTQSGTLDLYVDGADETDQHRRLIKGGGAGAHRRENPGVFLPALRLHRGPKQAGQVARQIPPAHRSHPMARSAVARKLIQLGRSAHLSRSRNNRLRQRNPRRPQPQNPRPRRTRDRNKPNPGVVTVGLFARQRPEKVIVAPQQPPTPSNPGARASRPRRGRGRPRSQRERPPTPPSSHTSTVAKCLPLHPAGNPPCPPPPLSPH